MKRERPVRFREGLAVRVPRATRLVICCRGTAEEALRVMRSMMAKLKLAVVKRRTRIDRVPGDTFSFLGYGIGRWYSARTGRPFYGMRPSAEAVRRLCRAISAMTSRRWLSLPVEEIVRAIHQRLVGWASYFQLGQVGPAYHAVDHHGAYRLRQWLRRKHGIRSRGAARFSHDDRYPTLGLIRPATRPRRFPWAKA